MQERQPRATTRRWKCALWGALGAAVPVTVNLISFAARGWFREGHTTMQLFGFVCLAVILPVVAGGMIGNTYALIQEIRSDDDEVEPAA